MAYILKDIGFDLPWLTSKYLCNYYEVVDWGRIQSQMCLTGQSFLKTPKGQMELTATHYTKLVLYLHIAQYSDFYHQLRWYCLLANELVILALIKRCVYWIFVIQVPMCQLLRLKMSQNLYCMIHESYLLSADALMQEGYKCTQVFKCCMQIRNKYFSYLFLHSFFSKR